MVEVSLCLSCWKKANPRKRASKDPSSSKDEAGALFIAPISVIPHLKKPTTALPSGEFVSPPLEDSIPPPIPDPDDVCSVGSIIGAKQSPNVRGKQIVLDHHIFESENGWKKSESMAHPTFWLQITTDAADYEYFGASRPKDKPFFVRAVTDTGAQSCLWSLHDFYRCGFHDSDLLPVKKTMLAANREEIEIRGAILVRLSGTDTSGAKYTAPVIAYVSPDTQKFYLSREALDQLCVIPKNFPCVGASSSSGRAVK